MDATSPEFVYIGFILPSLFALTLVGEGLYKIQKEREGYFTFFLGVIFMTAIILAYFFLFSR